MTGPMTTVFLPASEDKFEEAPADTNADPSPEPSSRAQGDTGEVRPADRAASKPSDVLSCAREHRMLAKQANTVVAIEANFRSRRGF